PHCRLARRGSEARQAAKPACARHHRDVHEGELLARAGRGTHHPHLTLAGVQRFRRVQHHDLRERDSRARRSMNQSGTTKPQERDMTDTDVQDNNDTDSSAITKGDVYAGKVDKVFRDGVNPLEAPPSTDLTLIAARPSFYGVSPAEMDAAKMISMSGP